MEVILNGLFEKTHLDPSNVFCVCLNESFKNYLETFHFIQSLFYSTHSSFFLSDGVISKQWYLVFMTYKQIQKVSLALTDLMKSILKILLDLLLKSLCNSEMVA